MKPILFDNLPPLSKKDAIDILSTPSDQLKLSSDYYKAVFHLEKYPGFDTEEVLINLLASDSYDTSIRLAKRKSIEVLGRLNCKRAIPLIRNYLRDSDPYVVENAAWAMQELQCKDEEIHDLIASLLDDDIQNRRVLIQALAKMKVYKYIDKIKSFIDDSSFSPGIYGAAIAAFTSLSGNHQYSNQLDKLLLDHNQNNRQFAIQDIMDACAIELIPSILKIPVSPFFKMRAVRKLWPIDEENINHMNLFNTIDSLIIDDPKNIKTLSQYEEEKSTKFLISQLFSTDFDKCYLALKILSTRDKNQLWKSLSNYLPALTRDYGALYFLINLFNIIPDWDNSMIEEILEILKNTLESSWPEFMKFRPLAIFTFIKLGKFESDKYFSKYLDVKQTPYWACRYSALMGLEEFLYSEDFKKFRINCEKLVLDENPFVASKATKILERL